MIATEPSADQPQALWTGWPDTNVNVEINAAAASTIQFDDSTPAADPLTAPSRSLFQTGLIGVKIRADVAWAINPGGVAYLTGAAW